MGAEHVDGYARCGEPLKETAERISDFLARAAAFGRLSTGHPRFNISCRPILGSTEGEAWDRARRILADMEGAGTPGMGQDRSAERLLELAARGEVHDERL